MYVDTASLFRTLLSAGRSSEFEAIRSLPGAGLHSAVLQIADSHLNELLEFFSSLNVQDRGSFIKAVAVYEETVGGLGSVTVLHRLFPLLPDPTHAVLDWVLANTKSYCWYANGAKSYAEWDALRRVQADRSAESFRREEKRATVAKQRRAVRATESLYNAVRRGDRSAVAALLSAGADPDSTTPDGVPLIQYAMQAGCLDIAALLKGELRE